MDKKSSDKGIPQGMKDIIKNHTIAMAGTGFVGGVIGAGADLPAIAASWTSMTVKLAAAAGHRLDDQYAKKLALAIVTSVGMFVGGAKAATLIFGWATAVFTGGASLVITVSANAALNGAVTHAYGHAASRYFLEVDQIDNIEVLIAIVMGYMGDFY